MLTKKSNLTGGSKLEVGTIVYIKVTGEPVMVLKHYTRADQGKGCHFEYDNLGDIYMVRRPVDTKANGITHNEEQFYEAELESRAENAARAMHEINELQENFMKQNTTTAVTKFEAN